MTSERSVEAVAAVIDTFGEALHARDLEASMALLAEDNDVVVIPSEGVDVFRGPKAVRTFLSRIYAGPKRYGWQWKRRWISVEDRTAWFVAHGDETVEQDGEKRLIPYCLTGVAVDTDAGWRLRLLHASEDSTSASNPASQ